MKLNLHRLTLLSICGFLIIGNGMLQWLADEDLGICWTHNVLRNWDQAGFLALKGQLAENPGGHDVLAHPVVYPGHRANSLYPAYFIGRLFAWTGYRAMPYHMLLTAVILISIWYLLGGSDRALMAAALAVLSPGYVMEPTLIDPNAVAILGGLIYAAFLWWRLRQPRLRAVDFIFLILLTIAFTSLNWTTALVQGQLFVALALLPGISRRRLVFFAVTGAVSAGLVVAVGLVSKLAEPGRGSGALGSLLEAYMWGEGGYSDGSGTFTLLVRLAFINGLALLPLWIFWAWQWLKCARLNSRRAVSALAPLALAVLETVGMRNYFSHHPWMAAPLLLLGCSLFLMIIMTPPAEKNGTPATTSPGIWNPAWTLGVVAAFCFGMMVMLVYREHDSRLFSVISLVRRDTARTAEIVVVANRDPALANDAKRLSELFDRWLTVVEAVPESAPAQAPSAFLLSAEPLDGGWKLTASTAGKARPKPLVDGALQWFMKNISKRKPGDRLEMAETYYLYAVDAPSSNGKPFAATAASAGTGAKP